MSMNILPLSEHVGVEVRGLNLRSPVTEDDHAALRAAFLENDLILVRQPGITADEQARFARIFGRIEIRNQQPGSDGVTQHVSNTRTDGILGDGEILFHQDHLFYPQPLLALILYGVEIPPSGSVTKFRSGSASYELLPRDLKKRIGDVECLHLYNYSADYTRRQDLSKAPPEAPRAWQPLVWTQPETGRKTLWLSPLNVVGFRGVAEGEGEILLQEVARCADAEECTVYSHSWQPGDLVLWNNTVLHHARMPFNPSERRTLRRTPIVAS